jgi:tetratricopeptide (TPR) repeat protein
MIDLEGALRRQWASFFSLDREDGLTTAELENGSAHLNAFDWTGDENSDENRQDVYKSSDEDYFVDFNSKKDTTTVTFCHASILDFFRDELEGKVSAAKGHIAVGVDYQTAKVHILKTYLRLITNPDIAAKASDSGQMLRHAAQHWGDHLPTTLPTKCSSEDRREIAKMLLVAFRSEKSMSSWAGEHDWALSTATIKAVRQWWQEQEILDSLSPEEKEFISTTEEEPLSLFKPMVMYCIKSWLWEDLPSPLPTLFIVWRYQMLIKGEDIHDYDRRMTAEEVVEASEFGGFEKTSQWFQRCAIALRHQGYHEEALQYLKKAMELNPDDWRNLRELAQTYHDQDDWQKSIEIWERTRVILLTTIAESPEDEPLKGHLHQCLERIGQIYEEQEDWEKRFETVQEAYQYAPACWNCIYALLQYHNDNHAYETTMDLLKKLANTPAPEDDFSELTRFLLQNVFDVDCKSRLAADAALATNDLEFVLENLQTAAKAARTASRTLLAAEVDMAIARIYDELLLDSLKAIRCWEKIMDTYSSSSSGTLIGMIRQLASSNLARTFLCDAVETGFGTPEAEESVAKLEKLIHQSQYYPFGSCAFVPAVYLGIWCRSRGEDGRARALFQPSLQQIVQNLPDDNPSNEELSDLKYTLIMAGDIKNVAAIAHRREEDNSDPWYKCRGPCRRKVLTRVGFHICPICLGGELCPDCVSLVGGAVSKERCDRHVQYFISIPPPSKEIRSGMMLVGGEEMVFETWLTRLKKEWVLGDCKPPGSTAGQFDFGVFLLGLVA